MQATQEKTSKSTPAPPKGRESIFNSVWFDVAGLAVTLASGFAAAARWTNNTFFQDIKLYPEMDHLHEDSIKKTQEMYKDIGEAANDEAKREATKALQNFQKARAKEINQMVKQELGIKNIVGRFNFLRPHQKMEVFMVAAATMAVALGTIATLASNRRVGKEQELLEARQHDMERNHRELLTRLDAMHEHRSHRARA